MNAFGAVVELERPEAVAASSVAEAVAGEVLDVGRDHRPPAPAHGARERGCRRRGAAGRARRRARAGAAIRSSASRRAGQVLDHVAEDHRVEAPPRQVGVEQVRRADVEAEPLAGVAARRTRSARRPTRASRARAPRRAGSRPSSRGRAAPPGADVALDPLEHPPGASRAGRPPPRRSPRTRPRRRPRSSSASAGKRSSCMWPQARAADDVGRARCRSGRWSGSGPRAPAAPAHRQVAERAPGGTPHSAAGGRHGADSLADSTFQAQRLFAGRPQRDYSDGLRRRPMPTLGTRASQAGGRLPLARRAGSCAAGSAAGLRGRAAETIKRVRRHTMTHRAAPRRALRRRRVRRPGAQGPWRARRVRSLARAAA